MMYVLGVVMAGGRGERLYPLTQHRAKPAVPFGGRYRIIDFVLSNFINSGILSIYVVTQFKAQSLWNISTAAGAQQIFSANISSRPCRRRCARATNGIRAPPTRYIRISICSNATSPKLVAVFGADHIYRMNVRQMIDEHQKTIGRRHGRRAAGEHRRSLAVRRDRDGCRLAHHRLRRKTQRAQVDSRRAQLSRWCPWVIIYSTMRC